MQLDISADQKVFLATARKFLDKQVPPTGSDAPFERSWWPAAAELGWTALLVPEEDGGGSVSGEGLTDLAMIAETLGRVLAPGPLLPVNVVIAALVETSERSADLDKALEALVSGEQIASWAVYEPGAEWDPALPRTTATPDGTGYLLDGVKDRVEAAGQSDLFLVTATTPEGPAQFLVPASTPGVSVRESQGLDLTRQFGELSLDRVAVGPGTRVDAAIERQLQIALVLQTADTCGVLDRVFEMTVQWAFDRYSFGRPLASYQALKHRFADMRTWLEGCQATSVAATQAVQERSPQAAELVSVAAAYVGDRSLEILQDCIQLHGGIGLTWEHDLHRYLRRATVNRSLYGTPTDHRLRVAAILADASVAS